MPSSVVEHIDYDIETQQLKITFQSGDVYIYYDVPDDVYIQFMQYKSKGFFLNKYIKDHFNYEKIQ